MQTKTIQNIIKRDGMSEPFDPNKITNAIRKSLQSLDEDVVEKMGLISIEQESYRLTIEVLKELAETGAAPSVEQIQDLVEDILIRGNLAPVAKAYILYRNERTKVREQKTALMDIYREITIKESEMSDLKRENGNINSDNSMGTMLKYGTEGAKHFNLIHLVKSTHSDAHRKGDFHINDLDFLGLTTTCCQIDIKKLFKDGFGTGHGSIREPSAIKTYSALTCIAIQSCQNDQHGGQSIPNFDWGLALGVEKTFRKLYFSNFNKYVFIMTEHPDFDPAKDEEEDAEMTLIKEIQMNLWPKLDYDVKYDTKEMKTVGKHYPTISIDVIKSAQRFAHRTSTSECDKETYQAMEALIHNLNTMHSRAGAQVPFSSVNYGTNPSTEGRMVTKNILLALESGLGNHETPIFPIHVFRLKEGINFLPEDPNYDLLMLAIKVWSKRLYPNFGFQDASFNMQFYDPTRPETEVSYMGCRTRVLSNVYNPKRQVAYGRGNLSFTTINLPRLGIKANGDIKRFFESLEEMLGSVCDQLYERYKVQAKKKVKNFPFLMGQGIWEGSDQLHHEDLVEEVLKNGTLGVGYLGLAETLVALRGKHHAEAEESQHLGIQIITFMREYCDKYSQETKMNFTLLATPAESTAGRLVKLDQKEFGTIPGVTDKIYYTNSFHVPVNFKVSIFEKINIEAPYHKLSNAGHITFIELDYNSAKNHEAIYSILRYMKEADCGYVAFNIPIDRDPACGYRGFIENDTCPKCGRVETKRDPFSRIRRVTGYLVEENRFNDAKLQELNDRIKHTEQ